MASHQSIPRECFSWDQHETIVSGFSKEVMYARPLATGSEEIERKRHYRQLPFVSARRARRPPESLHASASDARLDGYGFLCSGVLC
jgi:hypothetical protein